MRRAVRISLRDLGEVRANSRAVERPMPEDEPVIRIVFPERLVDMGEGMVVGWNG